MSVGFSQWTETRAVPGFQRGVRQAFRMPQADAPAILAAARTKLSHGEPLEALDLYEQLVDEFPDISTQVLSEVHRVYGMLPTDRYRMYQARHFDFGIAPGHSVLDIGSGHVPFPFATHLAEYKLEDSSYGRNGEAFVAVAGLPITECSVEDMPFNKHQFDFVYCSHVLEHVDNPEKACKELMRVARAGYIETPTRGKDLFLNVAGVSNHRWKLEFVLNRLIFTEYTETEIAGLRCNILMSMNCQPETQREEAFSALMRLKADQLNTMLLWEGGFEFEVRRVDGSVYLSARH